MTIDERRLDEIVAGFFHAATGATGFDVPLAAVQQAFGARAAVLQTIEVPTGRILRLDTGGPAIHECALQYLREYFALDPRRSYLLAHPAETVRRWWHDHETYDPAFVARSPYYREFLSGYGMRFQSTVMLQPVPGIVVGLALELPPGRGPLDADERHLAERLGRHVDEALRAHERVRRLAARALAGHRLLDAFPHPMWLIGPDRFVFHANAAAEAVLRRPDAGLDLRAGRLVGTGDRTDRELGRHLHTLGAGGHGVRAVIDARRRGSDPPRWLHLHALVPGRVLDAFGDRPLVLATLFDAATVGALDPFALGDLFGMTPAQARVAVLLAEGLTADAIATRLGCGVSTVRTHLRSVMAKLGARRASDAVRVLRQGEALWALPATPPSPPP